MNPKVDTFINKQKKWQEEIRKLREILLSKGLKEEVKWGQPCYTYKGKNLIIIGAFKNHCSLNFFKGGMIDDRYNLLIKPGENTQLGRQIRFTNVDEIAEKEKIIGEYILRAIEVEEKGEKPNLQIEIKIPVELQKEFETNPKLEKSFFSLTPGRQRAYLIYFSSAKQSKTRETRIKKFIPKILLGKGLND